MHHLKWKEFQQKYTHPTIFTATASSRLPKDTRFDQNGIKLPTPYALFKAWCSYSLQSEWSTKKEKDHFTLCVSSKVDAILVRNRFKITDRKPGTKIFKIGYNNSEYSTLAQELGYKV